MYKSFSNYLWTLIRFLRLGGLLLQIHPKSYLRKRGWFLSFTAKRSIDAAKNPIPWWSYGVIDFVEERLKPSLSCLEFGSGGSTVWLAHRIKSVTSIENDPNWAAIVKDFVPENVRLIELAKPENLSDEHVGKEVFDILIVDPLAHRINCAKAGLPFLSETGVVIWDNTDGSDWPEIKALMAEHGFKEISFNGLAPQEVSLSRTTIFYRTENIFGI
ncbi:class I SAM-dependent methyltransferase [Crenothrix sp.]|uniref:class I SAM-dependent methyltransferase n=1 Tax=Crenothrix sp. TaxID=3100433 RepID=UPI00374DD211